MSASIRRVQIQRVSIHPPTLTYLRRVFCGDKRLATLPFDNRLILRALSTAIHVFPPRAPNSLADSRRAMGMPRLRYFATVSWGSRWYHGMRSSAVILGSPFGSHRFEGEAAGVPYQRTGRNRSDGSCWPSSIRFPFSPLQVCNPASGPRRLKAYHSRRPLEVRAKTYHSTEVQGFIKVYFALLQRPDRLTAYSTLASGFSIAFQNCIFCFSDVAVTRAPVGIMRDTLRLLGGPGCLPSLLMLCVVMGRPAHMEAIVAPQECGVGKMAAQDE